MIVKARMAHKFYQLPSFRGLISALKKDPHIEVVDTGEDALLIKNNQEVPKGTSFIFLYSGFKNPGVIRELEGHENFLGSVGIEWSQERVREIMVPKLIALIGS